LLHFGFPEFISLSNGTLVHREEALLICLYRFRYPSRESDVGLMFNRDQSQISRIFNWCVDYFVDNWGYLLTDNFTFWYTNGYLACAIKEKLETLPNGKAVVFPEPDAIGGFKVFAFIDNTLNATCRPGGPIGDGPDAPRQPNAMQEAHYTGWKKMHGLKWQTVEMPNGMTLNMYGGISVRHNDYTTLNDSMINQKLEIMQLGDDMQFCVYGDSIYPNIGHIKSKHVSRFRALTDREVAENRAIVA
jgi:hypothetical protein